MSSVYLKEESSDRLHLSIEPAPVTWAMALGVLSFIIGYPLYSYDSIGFILMVWVLGTVGLLMFFSPWQEVIFDKEKNMLLINRQNFYQRYNLKTSTPVIYGLDNVQTVKHESPNVVFTLANYQVIELNIRGDTQKVSELVEKLEKFLQLDSKAANLSTPLSEAGSLHSEGTNEDNSSGTSDDSFERIDTTDLADYESSKVEPDSDIPSETIETLSPSSEELKDLTPESEELPTAVESNPVSADEPKVEAAGDFTADPDKAAGPSLP